MRSDDYKLLDGETLKSVTLESGYESSDTCLRVECASGRVVKFGVSGDCCSHSWIEHLTVPDDVDGATVVTIEERGGDTKPGEDLSQFDVLQVYETVIRTNRGDIVMEYRNDSNGYYGGSLDLLSDSHPKEPKS